MGHLLHLVTKEHYHLRTSTEFVTAIGDEYLQSKDQSQRSEQSVVSQTLPISPFAIPGGEHVRFDGS